MKTPEKPWHIVRQSKVHGNGVFAARKIPEGTRIIEYGGKTISAKEADRRHPTNPDDPFHTIFFSFRHLFQFVNSGLVGSSSMV